jgi:hypothetical protein
MFNKPMMIIIISLVLSPTLMASAQTDEEQILKAVQTFFEGIAEADSVKLASVLLPGGVFVSVREDGEEWRTGVQTINEFLESVSEWTSQLYERMWDPKVLIHGRIAVVWTPYDFYIDKEFSHCGMDAFNMVKTDNGWVIAGALYTVERSGCEESPLGFPNFDKNK